VNRHEQFGDKLSAFHPIHLRWREYALIEEVMAVPMDQLLRFSEKGTVVESCVSFLARGQWFASRVDSNEQVDDLR